MKAAGRARHIADLLWVGMFGPPVAWSVHLLLCYYVVSVTSSRGGSVIRIELSAITAAVLAFIALCGVIARRDVRLGALGEGDPERLQFMRRFSLLSAPLFFVATLFTFAPVFVLQDL